jgi:hypothetical protein
MDSLDSQELAQHIIDLISASGWTVEVVPLVARTAKPWSTEQDMPGVEARAIPLRGRVISIQARDWSPARAKLEACCLLAHHLGVDILRDASDGPASLAA